MKGFQILIEDFISKNPESVQGLIMDEWDDKSVDERLVYKSPIPLNSEQQQILSAINNDKCKYILVEGPPGTGKSHTITAIVFDTILKDKSVLVLSDKKEALDVVEKNIINTLNKVRIDEKFQNPLLRLGKTGNTYSQLLTQSSIDGITSQFRAVRSKCPNLGEEISVAINDLKNGVLSHVDANKKISLAHVIEFVSLKKHFDKDGLYIDIDEAIQNPNSIEELIRIRAILLKLKNKIKANKDVSFNFNIKKDLSEDNSKNLAEMISILGGIKEIITKNSNLADVEILNSYQSFLQQKKWKVKHLLEHLAEISEIADIFIKNKDYIALMAVEKNDLNTITIVRGLAQDTLLLKDILEKVRYFAKDNLSLLSFFDESHSEDIASLELYIKSANELKSSWFGYFGKKKEVDQLNQNFRKKFTLSKFDNPHKNLRELGSILGIYKYILELQVEINHDNFNRLDFLHLVTSLLKRKEVYFSDDQLKNINKSVEGILKAELIIGDLKGISLNITTINDLNNLAIMSALSLLYEDFSKLMVKESELVGPNIDLRKNNSLEILIQGDNLRGLIEEIRVCKEYVDTLVEVNDDVDYLNESSDKHRASFAAAGIKNESFNSLYENKLTEISDLEFGKLTRFIALQQEMISNFDSIKDLCYGDKIKQIENIVTMQMTYLMDERFVNFTREYKADAKALKQVIKDKKKFPKEQFSKLKSAFPCILSGIRDYAEYIPLQPEIFDLVIIDEASQVSIAQAFPALLRAKKVVVLGDNLQFSNVKSALARGDINKQHLANLKDVFLKNISSEVDKVVRLEKFNIKVSILDFLGFINNYQTRLVKHFRGYRELISYSNKFFYKNSLQVMKVRGLPIGSVLKFTQVKHDGIAELIKNTNMPEIDFIVSELIEFKKQDRKCTVGIITPHTNQQRLLYEKISDLPEADYFFDAFKLKIMTFDTCQGEEMDIIFYSMVATKNDDKLNYVFISDLNNIDLDDDEGKIKAQRLNVGLSRAKECMHFVLSKPIDQYTGTVKEFLQHYSNTLIEGQKELDSRAVDKKSNMEPLVLGWFYQTKFWQENKGGIMYPYTGQLYLVDMV